jgi:hypothetical protein
VLEVIEVAAIYDGGAGPGLDCRLSTGRIGERAELEGFVGDEDWVSLFSS